ncbi:hypothetical protein MKEN_01304300 [Mycena kentingensis (nom. inval.)]|nr:hypothetical protein MKEN_01304300 [Mycena kentingensis (nom. inval.)]
MSVPSLDIVTGALLVGTWANSLLYTVELSQVIKYFRNFPKDDWRLKALVITTFLIDTVAAIGNYAGVYLYTVTHAFDPTYLMVQNWTVPLCIFATGAVAVLVQTFLVMRYWRFAKNLPITLFLFLLIAVAIGASFTCGVVLCRFPAYADRGKVKIPATTWIVSEAVVDVIIALALLWEFRKASMHGVFRGTKSVLNRLAGQTIQTGAASASVAVAALIAYLLNNESNVPLGIAYCLGRVYVLTMLSNLNVRTALNVNGTASGSRSIGAGTGTHARRVSGAANVYPPPPSMGTFHEQLGGIHIHQTTAVYQIDPERALDSESRKDLEKESRSSSRGASGDDRRGIALAPLQRNSDKTEPGSVWYPTS